MKSLDAVKISANDKCPCGSGKKYKQCCEICHNGVKAPNALMLMKSRYSAYASENVSYIIKTTHKNSPYFEADTNRWQSELKEYTREAIFTKLEILEFVDGENEAFVTFKAHSNFGEQLEKSRFIKENGIWFYVSAELT